MSVGRLLRRDGLSAWRVVMSYGDRPVWEVHVAARSAEHAEALVTAHPAAFLYGRKHLDDPR